MAVIKQISQKLSDGSFSSPYDIGADAVNVFTSDGTSVEANLTQLNSSIANAKEQEQNDIKAVNAAIEKKADINHASSTTDYGVGTKTEYGHLKISDVFDTEEDDPGNTAVSQTGIVKLLDSLSDYFNTFQLLDEDTVLFSAFNTAYLVEQEKLRLIPSYYEVEELEDGNYVLKIK